MHGGSATKAMQCQFLYEKIVRSPVAHAVTWELEWNGAFLRIFCNREGERRRISKEFRRVSNDISPEYRIAPEKQAPFVAKLWEAGAGLVIS